MPAYLDVHLVSHPQLVLQPSGEARLQSSACLCLLVISKLHSVRESTSYACAANKLPHLLAAYMLVVLPLLTTTTFLLVQATLSTLKSCL